MLYDVYLPHENGIIPETYIDTFDLNDPSEMEDFTMMRDRLLKAHKNIVIIATRGTGEDDD